MKRETFRHPKLLDLASRLNCSRPEAIGYLQLLWDFTAEYAIQGDIGKHANGAIARACDYQGDPDEFITALVDSRWLDVDSIHRLLVHHWSEHCERWVKLKMEKIKKSFIEPTTENSVEHSIEPTVDDATGASPPRDQSNPIQSNPADTGLPPGLNLPAWERWIDFRRKAKLKKYKTNSTAENLARYPPDVQAAAVDYSIANEYQGLFPEKQDGKTNLTIQRDTRTPLQRFEDDLAAGKLG